MKGFHRSVFAGLALAAASMLAGFPATADPVADFYKGKQLRMIIGYGAGGGYDLYGRVAAEYLGRFISGNPTIVAQNMEGAGSKRAANYLYSAAPKDGTVLGIIGQTIPHDAVLDPENTNYDVTRFNWIGRLLANIEIGLTWHTSPVKTLEDLRQRETIVGGTGPASSSVILPRLLNALDGAKFRIVQGYKGSTDVILAMERGEVEAVASIGWATLKARRADWLRDNKINMLFQAALERSPEIPHVPALGELGRTPEDRAVMRFFAASGDIGRAILTTPDVPPERVAALRKAFMEMVNDPTFRADMERRRIEISPLPGDKLEKIVADVLATPKPILARAKEAAYGT